MKMPSVRINKLRRNRFLLGALSANLTLLLSASSAFADSEGDGPRIHEEHHSLEGLPVILVICALIIAVGIAYGIGRRSRK